MKSGANGEDVTGEVDISSREPTSVVSNGKGNIISGIHTPLEGSDSMQAGDTLLTQLRDRFEDARDALLENENCAQVVDVSSKVIGAGGSLWAFSKKVAWVVGTSALLLVVPLLYEMDKEMSTSASAGNITAAAGGKEMTLDSSGASPSGGAEAPKSDPAP